MTKQAKYVIFPILGLCLLTRPAYANAGTALMWNTAFYLLFGNLIIGIAEGLLLAVLLKQRKILMILYLIAANYASAFLANFILYQMDSSWEDITLYQLKIVLITLIFVSFIMTILIEWPFVRVPIRKQQHAWQRALIASVIAQTFSYCFLIPWYWKTEGLTLLREADITDSSEFLQNDNIEIYYIGVDGNIYQTALNESIPVRIHDFSPADRAVSLMLETSQHGGQLYVSASIDHAIAEQEIPIHDRLSKSKYLFCESPAFEWDNYWDKLPYGDFRDPNDRSWHIYSQYWPIEGLICENPETDERLRLAMETRFISWPAQRTFVLSGDEVIFELGQQICGFSLKTRQLTVLAKGRCPVVVIKPASTIETGKGATP